MAGKSQIHGWGAISKVAHKRGEMVIEYSGEAIRPSLADVRERSLYDQVVGAGTYIFKLNDDLFFRIPSAEFFPVFGDEGARIGSCGMP